MYQVTKILNIARAAAERNANFLCFSQNIDILNVSRYFNYVQTNFEWMFALPNTMLRCLLLSIMTKTNITWKEFLDYIDVCLFHIYTSPQTKYEIVFLWYFFVIFFPTLALFFSLISDRLLFVLRHSYQVFMTCRCCNLFWKYHVGTVCYICFDYQCLIKI